MFTRVLGIIGLFALAQAAAAQPCPPGTFSATGQQPCHPCPPGSFSNAVGAVACTPCPLGTFNENSGATSCTPCPVGTYAGAVGSVFCHDCLPGTFAAEPGQSHCTDCPAGSHAFLPGSSACTPCPAGTFANLPGSSDCAPCPLGRYSDVIGATGCSPCPAGTYSDVLGATACTNCACGTSSPPGAAQCFTCPGGVVIVSHPVTTEVNAGGTLTFSAMVEHPPKGVTATYAWRRDGVPLVNGGRISGADTVNLTINPAIAADKGAYDLVITWLGCNPAPTNPAAGIVNTPPCTGDANGDGVVNFADITATLSRWGFMCM